MRFRRPKRRAVVIGLVVLAAAAVGGKVGATVHVRHVTGVTEVAHTNCLKCHGGGEPLEYVRGTAHPTPYDLASSPDGEALYAVCGPTMRIAVIDTEARRLARWIEVPGEPGGVAVSPGGDVLAVSLFEQRAVVLLDEATGQERGRVAVGLEPAELVYSRDGATLFVANSGSSDVSVVDVAEARERLRVPAGREPFCVALSPAGDRVAVVSRMATIVPADEVPYAELTLLDVVTGRVERRVRLTSCHQSEGITFSADGTRVLVPALKVRNLLPITQVARGWVVSGVLCSVDVRTGDVALLPLGTVNRPFADPAGVAVSADGARGWVAAGGNDSLTTIDLTAALAHESDCATDAPEPQALSHTYLGARAGTASRPGAVELVNGLVAVSERLSDSVALYEPDGLALVARIPMGPAVLDDEVRRGARAFHSAAAAFQGSFSCRSCHPGGHTDGLTYDFDIDGVGRNVVLNRSLHGVKGTAPFKWVGLNPTLKRQCGARFAMVLTRADVMPDDVLDDLVAFLESMPPPTPTGGEGAILGFRDDAVARGKQLYFRTEMKDGTPIPPEGRCVTCHPPPIYSNLGKADVRTQSPWDKTGLFDIPHLTGIGRKAPYLHDGRAISLESIWTATGVENHHGVVTDYNKADLNDLIEFLRSL